MSLTMKKVVFALMLFTAIPCSAFAEQTFVVFGPERITRETGAPQNIVKEFTVQDVNREYRLHVQNGEGKRGRISSAVVKLNGGQVVGPNAFNKQVDNVSTTVKLLQSNRIEVEVRGEPGTSIIVRIVGIGDDPNPPVYPISGLRVKPGDFPINTPTDVIFNAEIPYPVGKPIPVVELIRVDSVGTFISVEGLMLDNGRLSNGDEIESDGVFSFRKTYNIKERQYIYLRVKATIDGETHLSEIFNLNVFKPITETEIEAMLFIDSIAGELYRRLLASEGKEKAVAEVVKYYESQSIVKEVGVSVGGIWAIYVNGMTSVIMFKESGTKGGSGSLFPINSNDSSALIQSLSTDIANNTIGNNTVGNNTVRSKRVLILAPFRNEFTNDDAPTIRTFFENHNNAGNCPKYEVVYLENANAGVGSFKAFGDYGIVHVSSHGSYINNEVILLTGTPANSANLATYIGDWTSTPARLIRVQTGDGRWWLAVTPEFFRYYVTAFPNTLLSFSACRSTHDNSMWNALRHRGAGALLGFSGDVPINFAVARSEHFFRRWINEPVTTGQAFTGGCSGGACWNLLGSTNLETPSGELQDGSFESGSLATWSSQGDGRIVSQLGTFTPVHGSKMGLISTGLGFTTNSGSLSQKFCIPGNATTLSLNWNFLSEEFTNYCGSIYQDFFRISIITENGISHTLFYRKIDDLCGSTYRVPFGFDIGQLQATGWRSVSLDISAIAVANAGKNVTLKFETGDVGDSIYDTAVLLDNIRIITR